MADEQTQYRNALKRARRMIAKYAANSATREQTDRAIDRAEYMSRWVPVEEREAAFGLRAEFRAADETARAARIASYEAESRRLANIIRERAPAPDSYLGELAIARARGRL